MLGRVPILVSVCLGFFFMPFFAFEKFFHNGFKGLVSENKLMVNMLSDRSLSGSLKAELVFLNGGLFELFFDRHSLLLGRDSEKINNGRRDRGLYYRNFLLGKFYCYECNGGLMSQSLAPQEKVEVGESGGLNWPMNKKTTVKNRLINWSPERTLSVRQYEKGLSCLVGTRYEPGSASEWTGGVVDACNGNASLSLIYTIDTLRSVNNFNHTDNAKYVRITVNPSAASGAGWHLVDYPKHQHTWFESWTHRTTWFGPVADTYAITLSPHDTAMQLVSAIPLNRVRESEINERSIITVGVSAAFMWGLQARLPPDIPRDSEEGAEMQDAERAGNDSDIVSQLLYEEGQVDEDGVWQPNEFDFYVDVSPTSSESLSDSSEDPESSSVSGLSVIFEEGSDIETDPSGQRVGGMDTRCSNRACRRNCHTHFSRRMGASSDTGVLYRSERSIRYKSYEYEIVNQSDAGQGNRARWIWQRNFKRYSHSWRANVKDVLYGRDWFFSDAAFSAAAYAHFIPGFSATFKVPASKKDLSTIDFVAAVRAVSLSGHITYGGFYQSFSDWAQEGRWMKIGQRVTVNWGSSAFSAEMPVSIEASGIESKQGLCINVKESIVKEGGAVGVYRCRDTESQVWKLDEEQRYRTQLADEFCLSHEQDDSISIRRCGQSVRQKWNWEGRRLRNHEGFLSLNQIQQLILVRDSAHATDWFSFIRQPPTENILKVEPL